MSHLEDEAKEIVQELSTYQPHSLMLKHVDRPCFTGVHCVGAWWMSIWGSGTPSEDRWSRKSSQVIHRISSGKPQFM